MKLTSPAFREGQTIPIQFTGEGEDVSPPLRWSDVPSSCKELILTCEDPDAPRRAGKDHPFVHWVIYNISPSTSKLPLGLAQREELTVPVIAHQGLSSFGSIGWSGPMPPVGHGTHHYVFRLYALDAESQIMPGATIAELQKATQAHVIDSAELVGIYERETVDLTAEQVQQSRTSGMRGLAGRGPTEIRPAH